jgi:hypothetical protein
MRAPETPPWYNVRIACIACFAPTSFASTFACNLLHLRLLLNSLRPASIKRTPIPRLLYQPLSTFILRTSQSTLSSSTLPHTLPHNLPLNMGGKNSCLRPENHDKCPWPKMSSMYALLVSLALPQLRLPLPLLSPPLPAPITGSPASCEYKTSLPPSLYPHSYYAPHTLLHTVLLLYPTLYLSTWVDTTLATGISSPSTARTARRIGMVQCTYYLRHLLCPNFVCLYLYFLLLHLRLSLDLLRPASIKHITNPLLLYQPHTLLHHFLFLYLLLHTLLPLSLSTWVITTTLAITVGFRIAVRCTYCLSLPFARGSLRNLPNLIPHFLFLSLHFPYTFPHDLLPLRTLNTALFRTQYTLPLIMGKTWSCQMRWGTTYCMAKSTYVFLISAVYSRVIVVCLF